MKKSESLPKNSKPAWHALHEHEVFERIHGSRDGLSTNEAASRGTQYGPNALPSRPPPGLFKIFFHQFVSPLIYILIAAGLVSLLIGEWTDAGFIFAVIVLNALLGTLQEWKAEHSAAAIQKLLKISCRVKRDRKIVVKDAIELVPGDVVLLESGDRVPADLRLFLSQNLSIDESLLTGESQAVVKKTDIFPEKTPLSDRQNLAFAGTTVTQGRGTGVVVGTASWTEVGSIASVVSSTELAKPPLVIRMEAFARQISYLVLGFVVLLGIIASWQGNPFNEVFLMAVALAVSAIPEGLPVAMTVALSIATTRMARRKVIVRRLTAVEGLGSCTCIASDKTGTLTVNRQTVRQVWMPGDGSYLVSGEGYAGAGEVTRKDGSQPGAQELARLHKLALGGALCNEASLRFVLGEWLHHGDAIDVAMLSFAHKLGIDPESEAEKHIVLGEIPFESEQRYAARFVRSEETTCIIKGAVEEVLVFCQWMAGPNGNLPLNTLLVEGETLNLAREGFRVLAIAEGLLNHNEEIKISGSEHIPPLTLLGLVAFIDPLRQDAKEAIHICREAGVRVVMVTGDHPATALGIAKDLGLASAESDMLSGKQLEKMNWEDAIWQERLKKVNVYSRVAPLQKLAIVEALNRQGHFTAVTGDGVNDAPALRKAHIGVAMGSGTDVAKETASIILADDNFASLVSGIEEGRFAYDNIRKVVYLLISTGGAEVVLFSLSLATGLPIPLGAVQLLWLNLVTNGIQDVALAFEGGEPGAMSRQPRSPRDKRFNRLMVQQTLLSGATVGGIAFVAWIWLFSQNFALNEARNLVLLLMVLLENVHVFNCRSERSSVFRVPLNRNPLLIGGVFLAQSVHILAMQWPFMQNVLGVAPVDLMAWLTLLGLAIVLLAVMEIFKLFRAR